MSEHQRQLVWDRHRACRSVRLGCLSAAVTVDLAAKLELSIIQVVETHIRPGQREDFREAGTGESRDREQRPVRLSRGLDRLLQLAALEDPPALPLRWLRPLGGKHQGHRIRARPSEPASRISVYAVRDAEDNHNRGLGEPSAPQLPHQEREIVRRDGIKAAGAERGDEMLPIALR